MNRRASRYLRCATLALFCVVAGCGDSATPTPTPTPLSPPTPPPPSAVFSAALGNPLIGTAYFKRASTPFPTGSSRRFDDPIVTYSDRFGQFGAGVTNRIAIQDPTMVVPTTSGRYIQVIASDPASGILYRLSTPRAE